MSTTLLEVEPGVRVCVRDVGRGDPVVFIAGWGFGHDVWDAQMRAIGEDHRVIGIDQRGHGGSDAPMSGYGIDRLAADIAVVFERLDLRDVCLVGWSLGGMVAFRVAAQHRDRVARLALVGTNAVRTSVSPDYPFGPDAAALLPRLVHGEERSRPRFRRQTIAGGFHRPPDPDLLDWLVAESLHTPSWAGTACFRTLLESDQRDLLDAARDLEVLHIAGADDAICPVEGGRWLEGHLDGMRRVQIDACGHYPMFEHPEAFDEALSAFVARGRRAGHPA